MTEQSEANTVATTYSAATKRNVWYNRTLKDTNGQREESTQKYTKIKQEKRDFIVVVENKPEGSTQDKENNQKIPVTQGTKSALKKNEQLQQQITIFRINEVSGGRVFLFLLSNKDV